MPENLAALFQKLGNCELSDKVFVLEGHHKRVTWQLLGKFIYSLSLRVTQWS